MQKRNVLALLALLLVSSPSPGQEAGAKGLDFFEKRIRPVLVEHCYKCHSAEAKKTRGGLALDTRAGVREGGDTGPAVVPGKPEMSLLLKAIRHEGTLKMPNAEKKLPDAIIADLETWIKTGAADPRDGKSVAKKDIDFDEARKHWAYQPVRAPSLPQVKDAAWPITDLDRFVLASMEAKDLKPAPDAARHAWLRRVSFDLTGLPPSPKEVDEFANDKTSEAHAKVVDRLLASPRFGEHWARHWLDGVRFNSSFPTLEHYRDWVVRALNADLPYDRFLVMQLAGDLLPPTKDVQEQADRIFATQMLMLNQKEMDPVEGAIEVVGQQVLGVSINCAKCHDHKFDAYTQKDYYALAGIITSTSVAGPKRSNPKEMGVPIPGSKGLAVTAVTESKVGDTNLLLRGEKKTPGPIVSRQFPVVLAGDSQTALGNVTKQSGRLELARWIADPSHPLTARVMVNRVWQQLFSQGIVRTPNDFGLNGDAPVNPALLDHSATRFSGEHQWSLKKLLRDITLSRTYRQSAVNELATKADPENRLYARAQVRRLTYEQTVDALHFSANVLSFDIPPRGPGPAPFPRFGSSRNSKELTAAHRAIYHDDPQMRHLFDGADPELLTEKRDESVTAPQMLFFLNNPQVLSIAEQVASQAKKAAPTGDSGAHVAAAYKLLFARSPSDRERERAITFLKGNTLERYCQVLLSTSEFSYVE